jgi:hypothetical protein
MYRSLLLSILFFFMLPLSHSSQLPLSPALSEKPPSPGEPSLYDHIMIERRATIFGDYVRTVKDITNSLTDRNAAITVLVPTNRAVLALARKPWVIAFSGTATSFGR